MQKLDAETKRPWSVKGAEKNFPTLQEFVEFLNVRCSSLELMTCNDCDTKSNFIACKNNPESKPDKSCLKCSGVYTRFDHLSIPRWLQITNKQVTLRGFSDTSEAAYACVIYAVQRNRETTKVTMGRKKQRERVVPLKLMCIPRLELNGTLLLARCFAILCNYLKGHVINIYAWTDSHVVLSWLSAPSRKWKPFVANRTSEILDLIPCNNWYYVPMKENPADLGSRGMSPKDLLDCRLWWEGPPWLTNKDWPKQPNLDRKDINKSVITETKRAFVFSVCCKNDVIDMLFEKNIHHFQR
ncbi:uncharacterized protein TNCT_714871 [Trichonephila clavata]|uniref:Uncharacterized protein n=1 Tax=Trichonephila clavata TaxID=2740835 RepID=A0A8X6LV76_TRICU|nr:uncharacterized protein TNCT_714871 [Trichonephila clavata]